MPQAPVGLIILDGWGVRGETAFNAPALARTPNFDAMMERFPTARLAASGADVGLPEGQIGNSEVGHLNIGSGRVVMQTLPRITAAFASGEAAENRAILDFVAEAKAGTGRVHLLGLLSPGGVHAHQDHLGQLASLLSGHGLDVRVHAFADGRDVPPTTLRDDLHAFRRDYPDVKIASLQGRYWAMDRDQRWERTDRAFAALCRGKGEAVTDLDAAIAAAHAGGTTDEFLDPMITPDFVAMEDGDALACFNFRADRVRQILNALLLPDFDGFDVSARPRFATALGMTAYSDALAAHMHVAFAPRPLPDTLGQVLAAAGLQQTQLAETEKYPQVTFFFNGGVEAPNPGEHRILVPSPKVATYDLQPEMSAPEVGDRLVETILDPGNQVFICNFANPDMVGHTGDLDAAIAACEAVDQQLGRAIDAVMQRGGSMLVTADHGNCETMWDTTTDGPHTAHTTNLVPLALVGPVGGDSEGDSGAEGPGRALRDGRLADLAPTLLDLLGLSKPAAMTGESLL